MNTDERNGLIIGGTALGLALLIAYLNGSTSQSGSSGIQQSPVASATPSQWSPTQSGMPGSVSFPIVNNVSNYNVGAGSQCSCNCVSTTSFSNLDTLLNTYEQALNASNNNFLQQTLSAIPEYLKQFVNNLTGWQESLTASQILG
jgi:hypothetical protein